MQLIHGNCLEEMSKIPDKSIDMILCDLPYGTTACPWDKIIPFELLWGQYKRVIKQNGAIVLFANQPFTTHLITSSPHFGTKKQWFKYDWVWDKAIPNSPGVAEYRPLPVHESILIFSSHQIDYNPQMELGHSSYIKKGIERENNEHGYGYKAGYISISNGERYPKSILRISNANQYIKQHSTQKPVALLEYLVKTYSNEGDAVLDNCMGSGSTGIACLNTKRDFIGIELYPLSDRPISKDNPDYFGIAEKRIARHKFEPINDDSKNGHVILF